MIFFVPSCLSGKTPLKFSSKRTGEAAKIILKIPPLKIPSNRNSYIVIRTSLHLTNAFS